MYIHSKVLNLEVAHKFFFMKIILLELGFVCKDFDICLTDFEL